MGLGQTLLTIMSLMLLGRIILSMNTTTLDIGFTKDMAEYRIAATSLGTSMMEETSAQNFDEKTLDSTITISSASQFSSSLSLDAGESTVNDFDDIDDYNGYSKADTLESEPGKPGAIYTTMVTVNYVTVLGSNVVVSLTQTYCKQITVKVTSPFLWNYLTNKQDTLKFRQVFAYWNFR